jgi:hypothetical protein
MFERDREGLLFLEEMHECISYSRKPLSSWYTYCMTFHPISVHDFLLFLTFGRSYTVFMIAFKGIVQRILNDF